MQLRPSAPQHFSTSSLSSPSSAACESSCSLDALERLVHFTGAGADACLFAAHPPQPQGATSAALASTAGGLRYWLNPSVQARQTTATCEITNLGPPFFAPTSTSVLRISAAPLFADGRCFPTRCVVSLATSAQRLDGVSLRPVVVTEWKLASKDANGMCATTVPLRTLYHLAVLISSSAAATDVDQVRLYLQLRFTGCSDGSDTHRIATVQLRYEQLGTASEVLPKLLQRRQRVAAHMMLPPPLYDIEDYSGDRLSRTSALLEELGVSVSISSSTCSSSRKDMGDGSGSGRVCGAKVPRTPTSPLSSTRTMSDKSEETAGETQHHLLRSPPQRSATRPQTEGPLSGDRSSSSPIRAVGPTEGGDGLRLLRVERALRIPPPPPTPDTAPGSAPPLFGGPWPPRKVRTIVLAPSISPSLCSSSAGTSPRSSHSLLPSPPPPTQACPNSKVHSPTSLTGTLRCGEAESRNREHFVDAVGARKSLQQQAVEERSFGSMLCSERTSSPASAAGSSSQRRRHHELSRAPPYTSSVDADEVLQEAAVSSFGPRLQPSAPQPSAVCSDTAVLWAATSLLGTRPWTLVSQHQCRKSTPAASVASSCASSRDRSARAAPEDSVREVPCWQTGQSALSKSFLDSGAWAQRRNTLQPPRQQQQSWKAAPLRTLDPNTSSYGAERTAAAPKTDSIATTWTCSAKYTAGLLPQQRCNGGTHVSPLLHAPRAFATASPSSSNPAPFSRPSFSPRAATQAPLHRPASSFVPQLLLRPGQRSYAASATPSTQQGGGVMTTAAAFAPPPSQNRSLWSKFAAPAGDPSLLDARQRRSATAHLHERGQESAATFTTSSPAALSLMPSSWLRGNATAVPEVSVSSAAEMKAHGAMEFQRGSRASTAPPPSRRRENVAVLTSAAVAERMEDAVSAESGSSAPLPPPPPSPPPPRSCTLFHSPASTQSFRPSSPSSSSTCSGSGPALPLQEARCVNLNRSHPKHHSVAESGGGHRSNGTATSRLCEAETFPVWKHHASRRGVGRRWLRIERPLPSPSASAAVRLRIALDKAHPSMATRASVLLGRGSNTSEHSSSHTANPSCEVCIQQRDMVEVWCGLRAYHSGLIHQSKVHHAECCLVIRCNAKLVTAVELESTEAVEAARRLLSDSSLTHHAGN
ncbi:hypothetical protein CUR178_00380 [Leishmania enriettii]|uniref:PH-like domain-containing protein n=1 Tax=Leishmania enriettii TaxID=5663 RepID=A0A836G5C0_LEIEN|nr:hypothetical protein CUR178_00380 [Leishmania enriettii]